MNDAERDKPATGFPEPAGKDPGDRTRDRTPHSALTSPAHDPDPTEWPDPYDDRDDPRGPTGDNPSPTPAGAISTSEPHHDQDPEAIDPVAPERDRLDS